MASIEDTEIPAYEVDQWALNGSHAAATGQTSCCITR